MIFILISALIFESESLSFPFSGYKNKKCFTLPAKAKDEIIVAYMISGINEFGVLVTLYSPKIAPLYSNNHQTREGDFTYTVPQQGIFFLCFESLDKSTKYISFEFYLNPHLELQDQHMQKLITLSAETAHKLQTVSTYLQFYESREIIYRNIAENTNSKLMWHGLFKLLTFFLMSFLMILTLTKLFNYSKKITV